MRLFITALAVYVACTVVVWVLGWRFGWLHPAREIGGYIAMAANCLTFILVSGRLAVTMSEPAAVRAAFVSSAAVLAWGWIRTALAAMGMRELLVWDHENVIPEAAVENVLWALIAFPLAMLIGLVARLVFVREGRTGP